MDKVGRRRNGIDKDFLIFDELVSVSQVEASEKARAGIMVVEDEHSIEKCFLILSTSTFITIKGERR